MANRYSDTAIKVSPEQAGKDFYNDYFDGKMTCNEHIAVMCLTQKYIDCKCGFLSRDDCGQAQAELFRKLKEDDEKQTAAS